MDNRLQDAYGLRPHRLTKNDAPVLARAILAFQRRQALVDKHVVQDTACIRIHNEAAGINILVRADDWVKVVPYLKDGTFDTTLIPVEDPVVLNPNRFRDVSTIELADRELYDRILTILLRLFPVEFPTSNL